MRPTARLTYSPTGFVALMLAGVIASPWYLKTWKQTGSPIFPFYMSFWKGEATGWDVERSALFQAMNSQYGGYEKGFSITCRAVSDLGAGAARAAAAF